MTFPDTPGNVTVIQKLKSIATLRYVCCKKVGNTSKQLFDFVLLSLLSISKQSQRRQVYHTTMQRRLE